MTLNIKQFIHHGIKKILICNIIYRILKEWRVYRSLKRKNYHFATGQRNRDTNIQDSLDYVQKVLLWYQQAMQVLNNDINVVGKKILEIGPGDSFAVALRFLQMGADEVVCIDKFYCERDKGYETVLYKELEHKYHSTCLKDGLLPQDRFTYKYGKGIEQYSNMQNYFNLIVSMAVLEHIYEIDAAINAMDRMLQVGGVMAHRVDLRDHGMFSDFHHPLTFLTIHEFIYKRFSYHSGNPNRKLINWYKKKFATLGNYEYKILVTRVKNRNLEIFKEEIEYNTDYDDDDVDFISIIRNDLIYDFKNLSNEELLTTGVFIVAKKVKHR